MAAEVVARPSKESVPLPPGDFMEKLEVATITGHGLTCARAASMSRRRATVARARKQSSVTTRKNQAQVSRTQSLVRQGGIRSHPLPPSARAQRRRERGVMPRVKTRDRTRAHRTTPPSTPNLITREVHSGCMCVARATLSRGARPPYLPPAKPGAYVRAGL